MVLGLPLYIVYSLFGVRLKLGKLTVVRDQAGKARVVAIANYWTQMALRPLHDYIFHGSGLRIPMGLSINKVL